jgi:YVTN family beta-propeller protein
LRVSELPQGTVTFLFTDIEGSTELLKRLGPRYGEVLEEHARILREAATSHGGSEVDNQGDSFFFVFARANAALGAAVVAQRALASHAWPDGTEVRVRMGLHTGEPAVGGERYVGLGVHRAARIGAAGHGGQVLLSNATRELVEEELDGVVVRELGLYRLKDIDRPERLYQLDIGGLRTDFPPLEAERADQARRFGHRPLFVGALAGVVAAAVAIPIFAFGSGGGGPVAVRGIAAPDSLALVDPASGRLMADVGLRASPTAVAAGDGAYWVASTDGNSVSRIDPKTRSLVQTISVGAGPTGITTGGGAVWVANSLDGTVSRIDPSTNSVVQQIPVGNDPVGIAYGVGSVWVANTGDATISKIDVAQDKVKTLPIAADGLAFGGRSLWASERAAGRVVRIDPASGQVVASTQVGNGPTGIAFGDGAAWVANSLDGTVSRVDPGTNSVAATIPAGDGPTAVTVDPTGVWVSDEFGGAVLRIDPRTNQPGVPIRVGSQPQGLSTSPGGVLVALDPTAATHRGGTLRVEGTPLDSIDTAQAYTAASWAVLRMTNDGLVGYDQAGGLAGAQPVPDLAVSLPHPTDGGRTYEFRLRRGIRYSNGLPVRASDVRASFERDFRIGLPVLYYDDIVGAAKCPKGKPCDLARGIVTDDAAGTVTFHLTRPDPEFFYKLSLAFADVLPAGTRARPAKSRPLPATGPYVIASYDPEHALRLIRNRHFREWSQAAQPDGYPNQIGYRIGATTAAAVDAVIGGTSDVYSSQFSVKTPSARQVASLRLNNPGQLHLNPQLGTVAFILNTRVAPFNRLEVRRAMNYAVDRNAIARALGGAGIKPPTCQVLPAHFPGYRRYCPYGTRPDLAKARELVARSGTKGMKVTYWSWAFFSPLARYATGLLRSVGYRPSIKTLGGDSYFPTVGDSRNRAQMGVTGWFPDYPAPSGFFVPLFSCSAFKPADPGNNNVSEFCDRRLDRQVQRALTDQVNDPYAARGLWASVDHRIVDEAPWIPLVNFQTVDVVSKRVGDYEYSPALGTPVLDQLWVH